MSTPLSQLLEGALARSGISQQVRAARIVEEARQIVEDILGRKNAQHINPASYSAGQLRVYVTTPVAGAALRQHEQRLLTTLRQKFPATRFDRLTIIPGSGRHRAYWTTTTK